MSRVLLLAGRRGVGKDSAAQILSRHHGAHVDAFADGFKRFARDAFGLPSDWVWGPSELRENLIPGLGEPAGAEWSRARRNVLGRMAFRWLCEVLRDCDPTVGEDELRARAFVALDKLGEWFFWLHAATPSPGGMTVRTLLQQLGTEFGREKLGTSVWCVSGVNRAERQAVAKRAPFAVVTDGRFANEVAAVRASGGKVIRLVDPHAPPASPDEHVSERELDTLPASAFDAVIYNDKRRGLPALEREILAVVPLLFPAVPEVHK